MLFHGRTPSGRFPLVNPCQGRVPPEPTHSDGAAKPAVAEPDRRPLPWVVPTDSLIVGSSDVGRVRARNEDTLVVLPDLRVAAVADGMGGVPGGDVASRLAGQAVESALREMIGTAPSDLSGETLASVLAAAVREAHTAVRRAGDADPELANMGTTLTVMGFLPDPGAWALAHVGDSRAYVWRSGTLVQLTHDHTWIQEMVDEGRITDLQAEQHPYRHILSQCIGSPDRPEPQVDSGPSYPGDLYVLCSDGLYGMIDEASLSEVLRAHIGSAADAEELAAAARALVDTANERGGEDNITVALVRIPAEADATLPRPDG